MRIAQPPDQNFNPFSPSETLLCPTSRAPLTRLLCALSPFLTRWLAICCPSSQHPLSIGPKIVLAAGRLLARSTAGHPTFSNKDDLASSTAQIPKAQFLPYQADCIRSSGTNDLGLHYNALLAICPSFLPIHGPVLLKLVIAYNYPGNVSDFRSECTPWMLVSMNALVYMLHLLFRADESTCSIDSIFFINGAAESGTRILKTFSVQHAC